MYRFCFASAADIFIEKSRCDRNEVVVVLSAGFFYMQNDNPPRPLRSYLCAANTIAVIQSLNFCNGLPCFLNSTQRTT